MTKKMQIKELAELAKIMNERPKPANRFKPTDKLVSKAMNLYLFSTGDEMVEANNILADLEVDGFLYRMPSWMRRMTTKRKCVSEFKRRLAKIQ